MSSNGTGVVNRYGGKFVEALARLRIHEHLCLIYETREEQFAAVIPFVRFGLDRGEKCLYVADENTPADVIAAMREGGIDTGKALGSGALRVVTKKEAYLRPGYFDPDLMIRFLAEEVRTAKEEGFSALRVTGEMTWALDGATDIHRLPEYETKLNRFFPENDIVALCQYNRARFPPELIRDVILTHPFVIVGEQVCRNYRYIPPDDFLTPGHVSREVDRLLQSIREREEEEGELLRSVVQSSDDAIIAKDLDGHILSWNRGAEQIYGYSAEEAVGRPITILFPPDRLEEFAEMMAKLGRGERIEHYETERVCKDGRRIEVSLTVSPIRDAGGTVMGASTIARDITARKRAEEEIVRLNRELEQRVETRTTELESKRIELGESQRALMNIVEDLNDKTAELEEANARLKELERLKSMFIASMSHELRTPLNSIIGFSSILHNEWLGSLTPEQKENLAAILRSGKHLLALINDVIDVSKIEAGRLEVNSEEFDLHDLMTEAVQYVEKEIRDKGLALRTRLEHRIICNDRRRLLQCIINLLTNALKFTERGEIAVETAAEPPGKEAGEETSVSIAISDTGIGIAAHDIPRLFQPFVRLDAHMRPNVPGTGLGLYLTRKLVIDILGGDILCTSRLGGGSTFTIRVPVRPDNGRERRER